MVKTVVIGILGGTLDSGKSSKRWAKWRPTIDLCSREDFIIDRFELLYHGTSAQWVDTIVADIKQVSPETKVVPTELNVTDPWDLEQMYGALHDFAKGYKFSTSKEKYLVSITTGTHIAQIAFFLLTEARYIPAQILQTAPNKRGVPAPLGIIDLDLSKYDQIAKRFASERSQGVSFLKSGIATKNKKFNAMIEEIEKVAIASTDQILLTGPTGAGKSKLARNIFELKKTRGQVSGKLVDVNCATLRGDGAMSALFGHVKGAYTGAGNKRNGYLKEADDGVLFLDEIGELGIDEQAMLLRALEEKVFYPVGSDSPVKSDFQLIAGTNRDLQQRINDGLFREDLLARINLWKFELPGIANRTEDIPPNLDYELEVAKHSFGVNVTMTKDARQHFLDFAQSPQATWPGNFRELNGAVRRMVTLAKSGRITIQEVRSEIQRLEKAWLNESSNHDLKLVKQLSIGEIDRFDAAQLEEVIRVCRNSSSMAAAGKILFAHSRLAKAKPNDSDRLRKYLLKRGITWQEIKDINSRS